MMFNLEQAIGRHVNRTAFLMTEEIARRFNANGYSLAAQDYGIMYHLSQQGPMTQVEIAALMLRDKTTITRRIDGLVKKGLVQRNPDPDDRRYYRIALTGQGETALQVLTPLVSDFQQELMRDISDEDKQATIRTLDRMSEQLLSYKARSK